VFYEIRDVPGLKKKPSTSELLDWLKLLLAEDIPPRALRERGPTKLIPPLHGALLKNEQDVHLFERLALQSRQVRPRLRPRLQGARERSTPTDSRRSRKSG
jgi:MoxR-like ATPase